MKRNILVSWRGSQGTFAKCSSVLQKSFTETTVPWRKKGTQFPCHIVLPVTFVPYNSSLVVSTSQVTFKQRLNCALCHIYFTDCADTDEYRGKVRSDLVEWFAALRDSGCWDWIIVVDTVRARENKTRVQLLEKMKSDFSKFPAKIVEVESSTSKMPTLTRCLRDQLVSSLDSVVVAYEDFLQTEKEKCYSREWNLLSYVDSQFSLSQLYGALGLQDQVLAQYDELHALISVLIWNLSTKAYSEKEKPVWLEMFLSEVGSGCPSLLLSATATSKASLSLGEGRMSLMELRVLLLARQLVALLDQYNVRLQSVTSGSIQTQYCALLLSYADNCLRAVFEETEILKIKWCSLKKYCWVSLFAEEVFSLSSKLADPVQVDSAADFTCHLWMEYCNSIAGLEKACGAGPGNCSAVLDSEEVMDLLSWLPDTPDVDGIDKTNDGLPPVSKIKHMLSSAQAFRQHYQKTFENSMAVLKHFNWKRHSEFQGKILADFLVKQPDCLEIALPYYMKLLNSLAKEKWEGAYVSLVKETVQFFEKSESFRLDELPAETPEWVPSSPPPQTEDMLQTDWEVLQRETQIQSGAPRGRSQTHLFRDPESPDWEALRSLSSGLLFWLALWIMIGARLKTEEVGSFLTDHMHVEVGSLGVEMNIPEQYQILFHVRTELPSAKLMRLEEGLCGGISQKLKLVASPGSVGTKEKTNISISSEDSNLLFRNDGGKEWKENLKISLPPLDAHSTHNCFLDALLVLRGLRDKSLVSAKGKIEWLDGFFWPYELLFKPLLYSLPRLNVLEDRVIFQDTMCCCPPSGDDSGESWRILPVSVALENQDNPHEVMELLNPQLEELIWSGEYKFVWMLPSGGASRYVMTLRYVFPWDESGDEYTYIDPVAFDTTKAVYELCCQITSRGLLCRAESQCDLVISLRSLHPCRRAELLTIGLEANPTQWTLTEKQKVVSVKESGLGQVTFGVVPRSVGYLPLPSVVLLRKNPDGSETGGGQSLPLKLYVRTEGKQVHVLAPLPRAKASTHSLKEA